MTQIVNLQVKEFFKTIPSMLLEKVDNMLLEERGFHRVGNNRNGSNTRVKVKT